MVSVLVIDNLLICANVGDSRAIIGSLDSFHWKYRAISRDHKPDIKEELARINRSGGKVDSCRDIWGNPIGPKRVWRKKDIGPGLAMSRSLGDKIAAKIGVISVPEIIEERIRENDKVLILASDGVWEHMSNLEVVEIVGKFWKSKNSAGAADNLAKEARKRWERLLGITIDDITAIVIFFD